MKTLILVIAAIFILSFQLANHADAKCMLDKDWPDKPCIDTYPPLPLSKSEWKDLWNAYFDYKGGQWMEQKKLELDKQIKSGTLQNWIESGSATQNFTNYNVWFYYYVNGKSPAPSGYELADQNSQPVSSDASVFPKLGEEFKLGQDDVAFFKSENILIKFSNVTEDSRCPTGVMCIWQGRVSVDVNVIKDDKDKGDFILTLGESEKLALQTFDGYYVKLLKVEPYPSFPSTNVGSREYLVYLSVAKVKDIIPDSPLKQFKSGIAAKDVVCKEGLQLVIKSKDGSPACVKLTTAPKLVQRGWANKSWSPPVIPTDFSDVTITLERHPCFGFCPIYSVLIYGNGTVNYVGMNFVETMGVKVFKIPADKVKELVTDIYETNFFSLNDRYEAPMTDLPSATTTVTIGAQTKSVYNYGNAGPQKLEDFEQKIDEITQTKMLIGEPKPQPPSESEPTSIEEVANLNNMLGFEMFANLAQGKQENAFFSPYSISSAFSILYEGARGTTQDEIRSVFHFIKDDQTRRDYSHQIISDLNKPSKNYILSAANALWVQDKFPILDQYKVVTEKYYLSKTENLDFETHPEESRKTINSWVEDKTNDKIKDLLPPGSINDMTRAVITNAVYFLGNWTVQFDEKLTQEDDFKTLEQKTVKVPMMNAKQYFNYGSNGDLQVLQMSYKGDDLSMLVLLPKDNDLTSLEKKLSVENLKEWKSGMEKKEVNVFLPKFKLEKTYSLNENLAKMGMPSVFEPGSADLSGIDGKTDLYVTGVFHKAFVAVDEKGTEAAAATGIVVGTTSMGPEPEIFRADHPFIFLIQDDRTGLILFMGKVVDPTS